jgi:GNAT superfamily N-acetyltransferase
VKKIRNRRELRKGDYGRRIFGLINESYKGLYGYTEMTQRQIEQYVKTYLPYLDLRMVTLVETAEGELVGVGISMPSLSRALQKAKGSLWPWGWWHLAKALYIKRSHILDLLLIGIKPEFQNKGVNALIITDLIPIFRQMGFEYGETNVELEGNAAVQAQWQYVERVQHKRRRAYRKSLS